MKREEYGAPSPLDRGKLKIGGARSVESIDAGNGDYVVTKTRAGRPPSCAVKRQYEPLLWRNSPSSLSPMVT